MATTTLIRRCQNCSIYRSRLYICHVCDRKLCGWCSFKRPNGQRVCCDGGDCHLTSAQQQWDAMDPKPKYPRPTRGED
jgi:hypothetical protein